MLDISGLRFREPDRADVRRAIHLKFTPILGKLGPLAITVHEEVANDRLSDRQGHRQERTPASLRSPSLPHGKAPNTCCLLLQQKAKSQPFPHVITQYAENLRMGGNLLILLPAR